MLRRFLFLGVLLLMWVPASSQGQTRPAEPVAAIPAQQSLHDHFIGWYRLPGRTQSMKVLEKGPATFIPIFKRNGIYYTVCRFFEVSLKAIPNGLEWDMKPSSMVGTKITFDAQKKEYAITVHDSAALGIVR